MDKSKKELESIVKSQKEQLSRYEARLKDVVSAYKGLLKEKEALELSLSALNKVSESNKIEGRELPDNISVSSDTSTDINIVKNESSICDSPLRKTSQVDLQSQIATLMHSLATLSAEKSRMEASFQGDKKKLRSDLSKKDETITKLEEKIKELEKTNIIDLDNMKSKIIVERHEREKESNDHMVMLRELQKLLSNERHLKESIEIQLNNLKSEFSASPTYNLNIKLKEISNELKDSKEKIKQYENSEIGQKKFQENSNIMHQLQQEMHNLKQQHATAIKAEQKRALLAEEHSKRLSALHEDRVANLEARLAELSNTVGTYDCLRQQDQDNIQKLKDKISKLANNKSDSVTDEEPSASLKKKPDVQSIFDEIIRLKKLLLIENAKSKNPVELNKIFNSTGSDHTQCLEDIRKIERDLENFKTENTALSQISNEQKQNIKTLQEKITVLNRNIEEQEYDLKQQNDRLFQAVKAEKSKWKACLSAAENDYRNKINELEQQLQKQRIRSLHLLDEKENEMKALKTSFELMIQNSRSADCSSYENPQQNERRSSAVHIQTILNPQSTISATAAASNPNLILENCHMLHYANEIARKDVEITSLRKAKYSAETSLRQALQDKVTTQEDLHDKISALEMEVDRLERCKSREGANLEYLKNVFISFLSTSSLDGKRHMINAISTILQFTPCETDAINAILFNKRAPISRRLSLSK